MTELQKCVVKALETCTEPTPANIVDSMFNFVRKMTPCAKLKSDNHRSGYASVKDSATTSKITGVTILISTFVTVIARKIQQSL